ncbi:MAG TPA: PIG-L family deacetylase [Pirellulales bacterium]|jgi:LmbE family N-acetylglucosaminyl deacetylase|nr:PIG-L family deacetylase [Pirellulales bacterium]
MAKQKTLLALGAHYDDCVFGVPGIMLKAIRKNWRVVIVSLIGDYTDWPPIGNRQRELLEGTVHISGEYGAEMRFLGLKSYSFDVTNETKRAVAEAVADVQPDLALMLWKEDHHEDHVVASHLSRIGLRYPLPLDGGRTAKAVRDVYAYDNGPRHTIGFQPTDFVDITDEWPQAIAWLGRFMALVRNEPYDASKLDAAQKTKEALARYRGISCGVQYAEAVYAMNARPREIVF